MSMHLKDQELRVLIVNQSKLIGSMTDAGQVLPATRDELLAQAERLAEFIRGLDAPERRIISEETKPVKSLGVVRHKDCVFMYCHTPNKCLEHGCGSLMHKDTA